MLQASSRMCIQPFCCKNIFLIKNVGTNKEENNANFIIVLDKNLNHFSVGTSTLQPHFAIMCTMFVEKTTKSSVAFTSHVSRYF